MLRAAFPDYSMRATHMVEEGDLLAARFEARGTQNGEFAGAAPTGRSFTVYGFDLLRVSNGRALEHWGSFDAAGMCQQLGIDPSKLMHHPA
jgi:predicted ester cyclase